jgi:large subunit ribosomal protein L2
MPLKNFKPITPSARYKSLPSFDEITKHSPEKSLTVALRKSGGRNNTGRITTRHIGGGHVQRYRLIDFKRTRRDEAAKVVGIEYDPNRSARIALVEYKDGQRAYILAPNALIVGSSVMAGEKAAPEVGNALPLSKIPLGTSIHNIELSQAKAASSLVPQVRLPFSPTAKVSLLWCACPPVKFARSLPLATPRSARSAMSST